MSVEVLDEIVHTILTAFQVQLLFDLREKGEFHKGKLEAFLMVFFQSFLYS